MTAKLSLWHISLRTKFIVTIVAILTIIFASIAVYLITNTKQTLLSNINQQSKAFASLSAKPIGDAYELYKDSGTIEVKRQIETLVELAPGISNIAVVDVEGRSKLTFREFPRMQTSASNAASFVPIYSSNRDGQIIQIVQPYFGSFGQHPYAIAYIFSTSQLSQTIFQQGTSIVIFSLLGLALSALALYALINRFFLKPIERLSVSARLISTGYYSEKIPAIGKDEIGVLALSIQAMSTALQDNITKLVELDRMKNEFIAIVSHNLRTPLSIIDAGKDMLVREQLSDSARHMVDLIGTSSDRLRLFSEQMLAISTLESNQGQLATGPVAARFLFGVLQKDFEEQAKAKGLTAIWTINDPDVTLNVSQEHIQSAVRILLDNAIKFTDKGGKVEFMLTITSAESIIEVKDTGIGIAPTEQEKLFTKFHRSTSTMQYNYEGTGIGLYAVKLIVAAHRGTVSIKSDLGKGTVVTIKLPT